MSPASAVSVNATAAALLGLLHEGPMSGGQLVATADERFGPFFSMTRSQVYRELPALVEMGLLRPGKVGARASQQYRITAAGKRAFRRWLTGPGGADALRSPLVLRLRHASELPEDERDALVASSRAAYGERLERACAAAKAAAKEEADPYGRAVAEFVVAHLRAMVDLLDSVPSNA